MALKVPEFDKSSMWNPRKTFLYIYSHFVCTLWFILILKLTMLDDISKTWYNFTGKIHITTDLGIKECV